MTERDANYVPYYEPTSNEAWQRQQSYGQVESDLWQSECAPHHSRQSLGRLTQNVTSQSHHERIGMPKVNEDMPISPPMGMNFRPQLPRDHAMPWKAPQMAHSVGYQPDPYHITGHSYGPAESDIRRLLILERRVERLEIENDALNNDNVKLKSSYMSTLDRIASHIARSFVKQQLVADQVIFAQSSAQTNYASNERCNGGILKASQNGKGSPDFTAASEQVLTENVSDTKNVIKEFLVFDRPAAPSASSQNHHLPSKLNNLMPNPYPNQAKLNIPPPTFAPILRPHNQHLNPPPAAFNPTSKSYEVMSAIQLSTPRDKRPKTVSFQPESRSVGAPPLQSRRIDEELDTDSDQTDSDSDNSENDDDREGNANLTRTIVDTIEKKTYTQPDSLISEPIIPSKMSVVVSPGSQRWSLQRKDSIHSLISEPVKSEHTSPFKRGAKSHSSLNRFRKESRKNGQLERNSSSANERSITSLNRVDAHNRGTPPSLQTHLGGNFRVPASVGSKKKKKSSFFDKVKTKLHFKKPEGGVERVETPTGGWMNTSLSPSKSDTNELPNGDAIKMTPGRKSIG